jgi:hypothetical protein
MVERTVGLELQPPVTAVERRTAAVVGSIAGYFSMHNSHPTYRNLTPN